MDDFNISMIINYLHYIVWGERAYPFLNCNGAAVQVYEWISKSTSHYAEHKTLSLIIFRTRNDFKLIWTQTLRQATIVVQTDYVWCCPLY